MREALFNPETLAINPELLLSSSLLFEVRVRLENSTFLIAEEQNAVSKVKKTKATGLVSFRMFS